MKGNLSTIKFELIPDEDIISTVHLKTTNSKPPKPMINFRDLVEEDWESLSLHIKPKQKKDSLCQKKLN